MFNYKKEFRYFDFEIPPLPEGFVDMSWHNNICPSFERELNETQIITLWVNYKNVKRRELRTKKFFITIETKDEMDHVLIYETDSWKVINNQINKLFKKEKQKCMILENK
jgi:hypothetical protein